MTLPFNWFDIAILLILYVGVRRGRKHGMSEEVVLVVKWLAIIIAGGFGYAIIGDIIAGNTVSSRLSAYMMGYFVIALFIAVIFLVIKKMANGKLIGSDVFGSGEYYLGMMAGMVRYTCITICALAFLNAPKYTQSEIAEDLKFQNDVYGSNFFPKLYSVQQDVFEKSFIGPYIHKDLEFLLIESTPRENKDLVRPRDYQVSN
jgi:uncharacterized membrane protein required for colicin V production